MSICVSFDEILTVAITAYDASALANTPYEILSLNEDPTLQITLDINDLGSREDTPTTWDISADTSGDPSWPHLTFIDGQINGIVYLRDFTINGRLYRFRLEERLWSIKRVKVDGNEKATGFLTPP